jgi:hypothetical protein
MDQRAFLRATALVTVLQLLLVLLGLGVPSLQQANLYPIVGTLLAVLAGYLFAHWTRGTGLPQALAGGALAAGLSSFAGVVLAALAGPADLAIVFVATVTGSLAGAVGGCVGRLLPGPRRRA